MKTGKAEAWHKSPKCVRIFCLVRKTKFSIRMSASAQKYIGKEALQIPVARAPASDPKYKYMCYLDVRLDQNKQIDVNLT